MTQESFKKMWFIHLLGVWCIRYFFKKAYQLKFYEKYCFLAFQTSVLI